MRSLMVIWNGKFIRVRLDELVMMKMLLFLSLQKQHLLYSESRAIQLSFNHLVNMKTI